MTTASVKAGLLVTADPRGLRLIKGYYVKFAA